MKLLYLILFLAVIYWMFPNVRETQTQGLLQIAEPGLDGIAAMFRAKIYLAIFLVVMVVYATGLTWNREHMTNTVVMEKITQPNLQLNNPFRTIEYNMNDIPIDIKLKLNKLLTEDVIIQTGHRLTPLSWDFVRVFDDGSKSYWYIEGFIQNSENFTSEQIIWVFWILPGEKYQLVEIRPYSTKETKSSIPPVSNDGPVISSNNLSNPLVINLDTNVNDNDASTDLEITPLSSEMIAKIDSRNGKQQKARQYNKWILPKTIWDKNAYVTFTPDILNPINYNTGKYADLFSRTRHDPSFPHGQSTA